MSRNYAQQPKYLGTDVNAKTVKSLLNTINTISQQAKTFSATEDILQRIRIIIYTYRPHLQGRHHLNLTDLLTEALVPNSDRSTTHNYNYKYDYNTNQPPPINSFGMPMSNPFYGNPQQPMPPPHLLNQNYYIHNNGSSGGGESQPPSTFSQQIPRPPPPAPPPPPQQFYNNQNYIPQNYPYPMSSAPQQPHYYPQPQNNNVNKSKFENQQTTYPAFGGIGSNNNTAQNTQMNSDKTNYNPFDTKIQTNIKDEIKKETKTEPKVEVKVESQIVEPKIEPKVEYKKEVKFETKTKFESDNEELGMDTTDLQIESVIQPANVVVNQKFTMTMTDNLAQLLHNLNTHSSLQNYQNFFFAFLKSIEPHVENYLQFDNIVKLTKMKLDSDLNELFSCILQRTNMNFYNDPDTCDIISHIINFYKKCWHSCIPITSIPFKFKIIVDSTRSFEDGLQKLMEMSEQLKNCQEALQQKQIQVANLQSTIKVQNDIINSTKAAESGRNVPNSNVKQESNQSAVPVLPPQSNNSKLKLNIPKFGEQSGETGDTFFDANEQQQQQSNGGVGIFGRGNATNDNTNIYSATMSQTNDAQNLVNRLVTLYNDNFNTSITDASLFQCIEYIIGQNLQRLDVKPVIVKSENNDDLNNLVTKHNEYNAMLTRKIKRFYPDLVDEYTLEELVNHVMDNISRLQDANNQQTIQIVSLQNTNSTMAKEINNLETSLQSKESKFDVKLKPQNLQDIQQYVEEVKKNLGTIATSIQIDPSCLANLDIKVNENKQESYRQLKIQYDNLQSVTEEMVMSKLNPIFDENRNFKQSYLEITQQLNEIKTNTSKRAVLFENLSRFLAMETQNDCPMLYDKLMRFFSTKQAQQIVID
ncbi:desmoplakin [Ectropis obliqua nucleopolyhedrovirus]|uniref:Desmoplakin n=1 Tax=Ectropis obliqua nucleopolyhedrovirus TaxID=59376 RepID=A0EYW0_9ABAC|nr:desmoplakin [Ectropis obliqua nucleopolyhedrovirus]ABI35740.1 desmoplakin [Ectropis obliqua nucleopolyhedrovirus]